MNPAFIILVLLAALLLWFLLSPAFRPVGKGVSQLYQKAVDEMNKEDQKENKEEKEKTE